MPKKGRELEEFVCHVFTTLHKLEELNTLVTQNACIRGRSGARHEFDVFYEFSRAGIVHRVAIECKDTTMPVAKGDIAEFAGKVADVDHLLGVIVSKNGYQEGAKLWAKHYGVTLLTVNDLPSINNIIAMHIKTLLPDDKVIGVPFWTLMEVNDAVIDGIDVNGNYRCVPIHNQNKGIPLFLSKRQAEQFMISRKFQNCVVRGIHQKHLRGLISLVEHFDDVSFMLFLPMIDESEEWIGFVIDEESVKRDYLLMT